MKTLPALSSRRFYLASRSTGLYFVARLGGVYHWSEQPPTGDSEGWDNAIDAAQAAYALRNGDLRVKLAVPPEVETAPYLQFNFRDDAGVRHRSFAMLGPENGEAVAMAFADTENDKVVRFVCGPSHAAKGAEFRAKVEAYIAGT